MSNDNMNNNLNEFKEENTNHNKMSDDVALSKILKFCRELRDRRGRQYIEEARRNNKNNNEYKN